MRLAEETCRARLTAASHGTLSTVHSERGVDAVPVVFAVVGDRIVIPVDTVKPKSSTRLQRLANLGLDDRCALLVDHYDDDWSQLWWVRVSGRGREVAPSDEIVGALAARFPAYATVGSVVTVIEIEPASIAGWAATGSG